MFRLQLLGDIWKGRKSKEVHDMSPLDIGMMLCLAISAIVGMGVMA